jgi:hypothetical protein
MATEPFTIKVKLVPDEFLKEVGKLQEKIKDAGFTDKVSKVGKEGGFFGGISGQLAKMGLAVLGILEIGRFSLGFLKMVSPMLGSVLRLFQYSVIMLLRPFFDFIGFILKPIVLMVYRGLVMPFYRIVMPIVRELGKSLGEVLKNPLFAVGGLAAILLATWGIIHGALSATLGAIVTSPIVTAIGSAATSIIGALTGVGVSGAAGGAVGAGIGLGSLLGVIGAVAGLGAVIVDTFNTLNDSTKKVNQRIDEASAKWGVFGFLLKGIADAATEANSWLIKLSISLAKFFKGIPSAQTGGLVRETGLFKLHKGEYVVPSQEVAQNITVNARINIGKVEGVADLRKVQEVVNRGVAEALRRRL